MSIVSIDGNLLRRAIIAGANELCQYKDLVDSLNVFPVPDGDTGTNMSLTVLVAAREVEKLNNPNAYEVAKTASAGSLRGARGNSGVILSQIFRGFAKGLENKDIITAKDIALGFTKASETAYKAVMKPKEGTILTICRAIAEKSTEISAKNNDIEYMMQEVIKYGNEVLEATMQMLPELKAARVVDAGGRGLLLIIEGACSAAHMDADIKVNNVMDTEKHVTPQFSSKTNEKIEFGYCTEFFINVETHNLEVMEQDLKQYLSKNGDSIVIVADDGLIKVHIHTEHPGLILEHALKFGSLSNLKIENMRIQHSNMINFVKEGFKEPAEALPEKDLGFVAIAPGSGFEQIFTELGVDVVIEGGQTMNPSISDISEACLKVNAKNIIILPNNKNIILAAKQAGKLSKDKKIHVIETKTVPQGIASMVSYIPTADFNANYSAMIEAIKTVFTGQITYAVRDTVIDEKQIKAGDILCMVENKIEVVANSLQRGAKDLLNLMLSKDAQLLSIYYGEEVKEENALELEAYIQSKYPEVEVMVCKGNQPIYYYIFSVE